jgi:hypothetical protein
MVTTTCKKRQHSHNIIIPIIHSYIKLAQDPSKIPLATRSGYGYDAAFLESRRRGVLTTSQLWHSPAGRRGRSMQVSYDPSLLSSMISLLLFISTDHERLFIACDLCYVVKRTTDWTERRGISLRTVIIRLFVTIRGFVGTRRVGRTRSVS